MTEKYSIHYSELCNPDINVFSYPDSSPCSAATSKWARWRITETARRTIFLANMINFYTNRDHSTGRQSSFYEPLNDELILNMPLPCSQAPWLARDEEAWALAIMKQPPAVSYPDNRRNETSSSEISLKTILTNFTKEHLQTEIGTNVGLSDSDELRRLIILCATEQFV